MSYQYDLFIYCIRDNIYCMGKIKSSLVNLIKFKI